LRSNEVSATEVINADLNILLEEATVEDIVHVTMDTLPAVVVHMAEEEEEDSVVIVLAALAMHSNAVNVIVVTPADSVTLLTLVDLVVEEGETVVTEVSAELQVLAMHSNVANANAVIHADLVTLLMLLEANAELVEVVVLAMHSNVVNALVVILAVSLMSPTMLLLVTTKLEAFLASEDLSKVYSLPFDLGFLFCLARRKSGIYLNL